MNWGKIALAGFASGFVVWLFDFLAHGFIIGSTYLDQVPFSQAPANPLLFLAIAIAIGLMGAILFSKSRASWGEGWKGGATFGFFVGLTMLFVPFFNPLVIEGFPYFHAWAWGLINVGDWVLYGTVASFFIKS